MATSTTATTEVPAGGGGTKFPPFESHYFAGQLIWLVIFFGGLYLFLSRWALPRLGGTIQARHDRIAGDVAAAAAMKKQADDAEKAYQDALAAARRDAQGIAGEVRARLAAEADETRKKLEGELGEKLAAAEATIAATKAEAMSHVEAIATDTAGAIVERLLGKGALQGDIGGAVKTALAGEGA
ncbi:MAG TPA: F0F1 ATP synthase subunit B' [Hyphomicrobiales bacterium]|nr:F0F1 ATP synthase subunit B' [Hyphomicrobiales bacterium]